MRSRSPEDRYKRAALFAILTCIGSLAGAVTAVGQQRAVVVTCQPLAGQVRSSVSRVILGLPVPSARIHRPTRTTTTTIRSAVVVPGRLGHKVTWEAFDITGRMVEGGEFSLPETGDRAWVPPFSDDVAVGLYMLVLHSTLVDEHAIAPYWKQ